MRRATPALLLLLLAVGCEDPTTGRTRDLDTHLVIRRLHLHPATQLYEWVQGQPFGETLETNFELFGCGGALPLVVHLENHLVDGRGLGQMQLLFAVVASPEDLCEGRGSVRIQQFSYVDPDAEEKVAQVQGPMFMEGRTLDARINLGDFRIMDMAVLATFPRWWNVTAEVEGEGSEEDPLRIADAEVSTVWTVEALSVIDVEDMSPGAPPGSTSLEALVGAGAQPDVDVDGDGLERIELTDRGTVSPLARCLDGDGTVIEGPDCVSDPRIVDGYDLRLVFRTERLAEVMD